MGTSTTPRLDSNPNPTSPGDPPELDLYTIPISSSWFKWDDIHEKERAALREFFEGSSLTRTPKIYKEYRDFIINKFREDPSRRLTFSETRKSLVGDVSLLLKVFRFLEHNGLINYGLDPARPEDEEGRDDNVRVEDGAPNGIRVVGVTSSTGAAGGGGVSRKLPAPLASYSDAFGDLGGRNKGVTGSPPCVSCGGSSDTGRYEYAKGDYVICAKCFENGSYGENRLKDDFKLHDGVENGVVRGAEWSDEETLLLLESVLRHGDDWDLVARVIPTKSKLDCISKLIELPFGDLILGSTVERRNFGGLSGGTNSTAEVPLQSSESQETKVDDDELHEQRNEKEQNGNTLNGDAADEGPPLKRKRAASFSDAGSSLIQQVVRISSLVGPDITSAAADAAITAICDETSCPREIFDGEENFLTKGLSSSSVHLDSARPHKVEDSENETNHAQSGGQETSPVQNGIPLGLRLRAAVATALGAAAAHARLLAVQEDCEIENLMTIVLETQLKKLQNKMQDFDDLELIMEKEYAELEELKESLTEERIKVLQRTINSGVSKWRDHGHTSVKTQTGV